MVPAPALGSNSGLPPLALVKPPTSVALPLDLASHLLWGEEAQVLSARPLIWEQRNQRSANRLSASLPSLRAVHLVSPHSRRGVALDGHLQRLLLASLRNLQHLHSVSLRSLEQVLSDSLHNPRRLLLASRHSLQAMHLDRVRSQLQMPLGSLHSLLHRIRLDNLLNLQLQMLSDNLLNLLHRILLVRMRNKHQHRVHLENLLPSAEPHQLRLLSVRLLLDSNNKVNQLSVKTLSLLPHSDRAHSLRQHLDKALSQLQDSAVLLPKHRLLQDSVEPLPGHQQPQASAPNPQAAPQATACFKASASTSTPKMATPWSNFRIKMALRGRHEFGILMDLRRLLRLTLRGCRKRMRGIRRGC
jgi:hypothetical protein